MMFVWALNLWMMILWWEVLNAFTIPVMESLSWWVYWEDGFLMWMRRTYMLLRLSMNMNVSVGSVLVCCVVIRSAYTSTMRILGYPGRRATMLTCSSPLKTPALAILPFSSPSGGVNEPSVQ